MKLPLLLATVLSIGLLNGCVINVGKDVDYNSQWEKREQENRAYISTLELNMTEAEIRTRLGEPDFSEGYSDGVAQQAAPVRVLFYRTQRKQEDGITTKAECTPLVFRSGKLMGWGDKAYSANH